MNAKVEVDSKHTERLKQNCFLNQIFYMFFWGNTVLNFLLFSLETITVTEVFECVNCQESIKSFHGINEQKST